MTAVVVVMGIFIKVCAVHTPSSNPSKPKARRISDTLRRRPRSAQRCGGLAGGGQSHDSHAVALTEASQSTDEPSDFGRSLSDSRSCNRCINHPRAFKVSGSQSSAIPSAADVQKLLVSHDSKDSAFDSQQLEGLFVPYIHRYIWNYLG